MHGSRFIFRRTNAAVLVLFVLIFTGLAQSETTSDKEAIYQAGLNYIEGFYEGDVSKLKAALDPSLKKFGFWKDAKTGKFGDENRMSFEEALKYAENVKKERNFAKPEAPKKVEIIDFTDKIAAVRISAWWGVDYMLLAKNDGNWMIEQVIWEGPSLESKATDDDRVAIKRAALNYLEGFYEGDPTKLSASLKPTLFKFGYGFNKKSREYREGSQMTFEEALSYAREVKEKEWFPKSDAPKEVEVLEVMNVIGLAKVTAWWGIDYVLLAKNGDNWMIEQVLWAGMP